MNRHIFLLIFLFFLNGFAISQEVEFNETDWQNPAIFEKGQTEPHAFHIPFSSKQAA